ncbi:hypothetical protein HIM_04382 [Hirsutella minnesotensis 3608]|uniref:Uncharacterized protein n=1 Tax=Hirsutella minnesotensis 3608 TaxID=1043627 RepID=A0A0F7ZPY3_9HYPO|nr:hypothetical protein HIM_04382 [Hirsutella minnesotensis 3608]
MTVALTDLDPPPPGLLCDPLVSSNLFCALVEYVSSLAMAAGDVTPPVPPQPLLWVIIPLLAVLTAGCFTFWMWKRHRRARSGTSRTWPEERTPGHDGSMVRTSRRWGALTGSRSVEGLNELGEAPPPYEAKSPPPPSPSDYEDDDLFDVEAAVRPPRYCQALPPGHQLPPPAHTAPPPPPVVISV